MSIPEGEENFLDSFPSDYDDGDVCFDILKLLDLMTE
jgi:hypothetical protein